MFKCLHTFGLIVHSHITFVTELFVSSWYLNGVEKHKKQLCMCQFSKRYLSAPLLHLSPVSSYPDSLSLRPRHLPLTSFFSPRTTRDSSIECIELHPSLICRARNRSRERCLFSSPSSSCFLPLRACQSPLPEQRVNENRQTNEGQQHIAAHRGLGLIDSPGDLSCARGVLDF